MVDWSFLCFGLFLWIFFGFRLPSHKLSEHNEDALVDVDVDACDDGFAWLEVLVRVDEAFRWNKFVLRIPSIKLLNEWLRLRFIERDGADDLISIN